MFTTRKKVIVSVINDLATDQRVLRTCKTLEECGYEVLLVGRELRSSRPVSHLPFKTHRMKLIFTKGPLFYFFFNLRLFFFLLLNKCDLLFANDLDTLWPNFRMAEMRGIPLIYDSHEIFCEVPELQNTPFKKKIWEKLESFIVPKLNYCITVNDSIAAFFGEKYKVGFTVVRNIPDTSIPGKTKSRTELGIPADKKILIYQGSGINIQRGAEELVQAMQYVENAHLFIIGGGDVFPLLKKMRNEFHLESKITIIDKLPKEELMNYTQHADLGISIDKDTNLNYHFSLPNKLFDYLQAGIPVLATKLPEIENIIRKYHVGGFIENHDPHHIAERINEIVNSDDLSQMKQNTVKACSENNWEKEKEKLVTLIRSVQR